MGNSFLYSLGFFPLKMSVISIFPLDNVSESSAGPWYQKTTMYENLEDLGRLKVYLNFLDLTPASKGSLASLNCLQS